MHGCPDLVHPGEVAYEEVGDAARAVEAGQVVGIVAGVPETKINNYNSAVTIFM